MTDISAMIKIAGTVLAKAHLIDPRIQQPTKETIKAWAECFALAPGIWPRESLEAVTKHYSRKNPFPIMPGDVIAHCEQMPVWSSSDHAAQFLDHWSSYPYSDTIARHTGIQWPEITPPDGLDLAAEREWLVKERCKWVTDNRQMLIGAILSQRYGRGELEQ